MSDVTSQALTVFMAFFAIMNPIANTAIFVGLTAGQTRSVQVNVALRALITCLLIITVFALAGKTIFHLFGITLPALRVTGGILLFVIGYQMLQGSPSSLHSAPDGPLDINIAYSPIAVPILAGPGTIATAMSFSAAGDWLNISITVATFSLLCLITFFCFVFGQRVIGMIGTAGLAIITRLMGLIIAVIGTQMVMQGLGSSELWTNVVQ